MLLIEPAARAGIVVLTNSDAAGATQLAPELLRAVLGAPAKARKEITIDPRLYDDYAGVYQMNDFRLTFSREGDRLFAETSGQKFQMFPQSARDFFLKGLEVEVTFVAGPDRRATELVLHEAGVDTHLSRSK